jgi:hypothetical protein
MARANWAGWFRCANYSELQKFCPVGGNGWHGKKPVTIGWGGIRLFPMTGPVGGNRTKLLRTPLKMLVAGYDQFRQSLNGLLLLRTQFLFAL